MEMNVPVKQFARELNQEIKDDNVSNGAAALAYYLMLSIFPAASFLLSLLPYLPIPNLQKAIMDALYQALPGDAAQMFAGVVESVTTQQRGGLLSVSLLFTLWAASNGIYAVMQQLNITYDVKEGRPFWKARATAIGLMVMFVGLIVLAFSLVVFGGTLQEWIGSKVGMNPVILFAFAALRWGIIGATLLLTFALTYYWGPDVKQKFRFISPGSFIGTLVLAAATLGFKFYVTNFGKYNATYGSIGAVIVLMLWLYITGLVILLGSEINALVEHHSSEGKNKGEKVEGQGQAA
jgi:membrane protein